MKASNNTAEAPARPRYTSGRVKPIESDQHRDARLQIRMSYEEKEMLRRYAKLMGLSLSKALISLALTHLSGMSTGEKGDKEGKS